MPKACWSRRDAATHRGETVTLLVSDSRIVNHRIKAAERVDLFGDALGGGDRIEVADNDRLGGGQSALGLMSPCLIARVRDDLVALFDQQFRSHQTKTGRRAGY